MTHPKSNLRTCLSKFIKITHFLLSSVQNNWVWWAEEEHLVLGFVLISLHKMQLQVFEEAWEKQRYDNKTLASILDAITYFTGNTHVTLNYKANRLWSIPLCLSRECFLMLSQQAHHLGGKRRGAQAQREDTVAVWLNEIPGWTWQPSG